MNEAICISCRLAGVIALGPAAHAGAVESGHSQCEGARGKRGCACACGFATGRQCVSCREFARTLDRRGRCRDRKECSVALRGVSEALRTERATRQAVAPVRGSGGQRVPKKCGCGCGEMTKGGRFRPGHDMRVGKHDAQTGR